MTVFDENVYFLVRDSARLPVYYVNVNEKGLLTLSEKLVEHFLGKWVQIAAHKKDNTLHIQVCQEGEKDALLVKKNGNIALDFRAYLENKGYVELVKYVGDCPQEGIWEGKTTPPPAAKKSKKN